MEFNKTELRVMGDLLGVQLETFTDWYNNGLEENYEFQKEFMEVSHVLDKLEEDNGGPLWTTATYLEGRRLYKEGLKFKDLTYVGISECEVYFNDSSKVTVQWMGVPFEFGKDRLEQILENDKLSDEGVIVDSDKSVVLTLYKENVEYLLENIKK